MIKSMDLMLKMTSRSRWGSKLPLGARSSLHARPSQKTSRSSHTAGKELPHINLGDGLWYDRARQIQVGARD
jgi:hypothetical protein